MGDEDEWKSLPTLDKVQHSQWKARLQGYQEAVKLFTTQTSENAPVFNDYVSLIKKFALDSNAISQEAGLNAVLAFLENAAVAVKCAPDLCAALTSKGLPAARPKTKDKSIECLLQLVELERHEVACEELLKGLCSKNPKLVVGCLQTLREILNLFGPKVVPLKTLIKEFPRLFDDRDKNVRNEAKNIIVEIYRWVGQGNKSLLADLKPVVVAEITSILDELPTEKPVPQRYLKSQQRKSEPTDSDGTRDIGGPGGSSAPTEENDQVDLNDLVAPVEVLSKIPNDYWTLIVEKKWQDRQQALESVDALTNVPRIAPGDFGALFKSLLTVVNKDTNVVLVALGTKILGQLATGLGKKFSPYSQATVAACLGKFKERKTNLIAALRITIDAAAKAVPLDAIFEDVVAALGHKTPSVRAETAAFLTRLFGRCSPSTLTVKLLKSIIPPLCETSRDTAGDVRENSFAALGAAMRVVGSRTMEPLLANIDALRMSKIKEYCDQTAGDSGTKSENAAESRPGTAPAAANSKPKRGAPPIQRPATASTKESPSEADGVAPPAKSVSGGPPKKKGTTTKATTVSSKPSLPTETLLSDEQIVQKASELLGEELINQLVATEWKERLAAMTELQQRFQTMDSSNRSTQIWCRIVLRKPGLKDTNVQVLRARLDYLQSVLDASQSVSSNLVELLIPDLLDKIGDVKAGEVVKTVLTTLSERCSFAVVGDQVLKGLFQMKNPRNQSESLSWLAQTVREFGMKLPPQDVISSLRTGLNATNPAVRQSSLALAGTVHLFMGEPMRNLLADEKPAVLALLNAEFDKNSGQKPPTPTRGPLSKSGPSGQSAEVADGPVAVEGGATADEEEPDSEALLPRTDIRSKLTGEILVLLSSKAWKERQEGLTSIQGILNSAKYIEGSHGALQEPLVAVARLCADANKNLVKFALNVLRDFAVALPKSDAAKYVQFVEPPILLTFGDSKPQVREAAVAALIAWQSRVPFSALVDNGMLSDALKVENAALRSELLHWLTDALSVLPANYRRQLPSDFPETLMPWVFASMEDRNPDARKNAQSCLPQLVRVLGWDVVSKAANRLKATSKDSIMPHLEKAKEAIVSKPEQNASSAGTTAPKKVARGQKAESTVSSATSDVEDSSSAPSISTTARSVADKKKPDAKKPSNAGSKKPPVEEPGNVALLQANKSAKSARLNDEKKRKLLKWDFDAPTRDHVQQLNQLFAASGASPDLHGQLFHSDFRQHLKAIDQLSQFMTSSEGEEAIFMNVDLLLRWIVLRFFETNPVVLGRCLDFVIKLFSRLSEAGLTLSEHEAGAFLPYLVLKAGDSKDAIRDGVRDIFRLSVNLYSPGRLFVFLSNGLKSKINKTRQECLKEMGSLIERFGMTVCQPSIPVALKSIAQQIGDRDGEVRSAALNALVFAFGIVGEQLWKLVGPLSDKDRSMLEERIKRAGPLPTIAISEVPETRVARTGSVRRQREPSDSRQTIPDSVRLASKQVEQVSAAQRRAREMLSELGDLSPEKAPGMPDLVALDAEISDLFKPFDIPTLKTQSRQPILTALLRTSPDTASAITMVVTAISSSDILVSCHALAEIDTVLRDEKWYLLLSHVNQILILITMQLRQITTRYFGDPSATDDDLRTLIRCHLATLDSLFGRPTLAREASTETLRELVQSLLHLMLDERTTTVPDGENIVRAVNSLCMRIIDASNGTRILSALIRLLHESVSNGQFTNRFTQSVMKGLWRITKGMDAAMNSYSFDVILVDCHHFLKAFPSASWKTRKSDVPIRTIKTMLHMMCRLQGSAILDFMDSVPNKESSELEAYLNRTLQTLGATSSVTGHTRRASGTDGRVKSTIPSAAARERLTEIFKKVGSNNPDEGLNELYDFTQLYPEMDLSVFLSKTSQFFQAYIKQALKNIAVERTRQTKMTVTGADGDANRLRTSLSGPLTGTGIEPDILNAHLSTTSMDPHSIDPKVFMNRLAQLRRELGLGGVSTTNVDEGPCWPGTTQLNGDEGGLPITALENTLRNMVSPAQPEGEQADQSATAPCDSRPTMSAQELLDIKRRLDRIKSGQVA